MCVAIIVATFVVYRFVSSTSQDNEVSTPTQDQNVLSSQTNSEGIVTVKVTPENISEDKKRWQFQIVLDAHTGSLDEDLTKNAILIDNQGSEQKPTTWDGAPPGGHHREGLITFEPFSQIPKSVTLILRSVGGINERKFSWSLK